MAVSTTTAGWMFIVRSVETGEQLVSAAQLFCVKGLTYMSSCVILITESGRKLAQSVNKRPAIAGLLIKGERT